MENTIKLIAPAKVNLFLAVGEKTGDYHPVINVMHTLVLHDVLYMTYSPAHKTKISIDMLQGEDPDISIPDVKLEDNLVYKAINSIAKVSHKNFDIKVILEKNIPHQAGLGGGSSDAAAALIGAAKIFNYDEDKLFGFAANLGSDVPFFLNGGCALYKGRGEVFNHKIQPINRDIVLVKPQGENGLSTKSVYKTFDDMNIASSLDSPFTYDEKDHKTSLSAISKELTIADNIPLFNNLAPASEKLMPELAEIKEFMAGKVGEDKVLLCGSGAATFAYDDDAEKYKSQGWWACETSLANVKIRPREV
ncbi:MAG: 4-(cytidine 5'-diphospho)-2-C-methyl-D-erythritol kinase [Coriobacteriia bacterium]|nr:4-(cytidine 5'-diphospho)-2-C-methyl-D-erythritol kinase [Coriobacteriia bacterium]